jgi:hypothetical protein
MEATVPQRRPEAEMYDDYYLEQLARQRHDDFRRELEAAQLARIASAATTGPDVASGRRRERRLAGAFTRVLAVVRLRPTPAPSEALPRTR